MTCLLLMLMLSIHIQAFLGLKHCPREERNITVKWGDTAQLPCSFVPPKGISKDGVLVSWQKEMSDIDLVVHFQNGKEEGDQQDERFRGRTLVTRSWFQDGNAMLSLRRVTGEDSGTYTCWITVLPLRPGTQKKCGVVTLTISEQMRKQEAATGGHVLGHPGIAWILVFLIIGLLAVLPCLMTSKWRRVICMEKHNPLCKCRQQWTSTYMGFFSQT